MMGTARTCKVPVSVSFITSDIVFQRYRSRYRMEPTNLMPNSRYTKVREVKYAQVNILSIYIHVELKCLYRYLLINHDILNHKKIYQLYRNP